MDRLKTKLQVKSFITKKIINEINRKIGLKYLTEGPERFLLHLSRRQEGEQSYEEYMKRMKEYLQSQENPQQSSQSTNTSTNPQQSSSNLNSLNPQTASTVVPNQTELVGDSIFDTLANTTALTTPALTALSFTPWGSKLRGAARGAARVIPWANLWAQVGVRPVLTGGDQDYVASTVPAILQYLARPSEQIPKGIVFGRDQKGGPVPPGKFSKGKGKQSSDYLPKLSTPQVSDVHVFTQSDGVPVRILPPERSGYESDQAYRAALRRHPFGLGYQSPNNLTPDEQIRAENITKQAFLGAFKKVDQSPGGAGGGSQLTNLGEKELRRMGQLTTKPLVSIEKSPEDVSGIQPGGQSWISYLWQVGLQRARQLGQVAQNKTVQPLIPVYDKDHPDLRNFTSYTASDPVHAFPIGPIESVNRRSKWKIPAVKGAVQGGLAAASSPAADAVELAGQLTGLSIPGIVKTPEGYSALTKPVSAFRGIPADRSYEKLYAETGDYPTYIIPRHIPSIRNPIDYAKQLTDIITATPDNYLSRLGELGAEEVPNEDAIKMLLAKDPDSIEKYFKRTQSGDAAASMSGNTK